MDNDRDWNAYQSEGGTGTPEAATSKRHCLPPLPTPGPELWQWWLIMVLKPTHNEDCSVLGWGLAVRSCQGSVQLISKKRLEVGILYKWLKDQLRVDKLANWYMQFSSWPRPRTYECRNDRWNGSQLISNSSSLRNWVTFHQMELKELHPLQHFFELCSSIFFFAFTSVVIMVIAADQGLKTDRGGKFSVSLPARAKCPCLNHCWHQSGSQEVCCAPTWHWVGWRLY